MIPSVYICFNLNDYVKMTENHQSINSPEESITIFQWEKRIRIQLLLNAKRFAFFSLSWNMSYVLADTNFYISRYQSIFWITCYISFLLEFISVCQSIFTLPFQDIMSDGCSLLMTASIICYFFDMSVWIVWRIYLLDFYSFCCW